MSRRSGDGEAIAVLGLTAFILAASIAWALAWNLTHSTYTGCTVTNLENQVKRAENNARGELKLAYTKGCDVNVFAVDDNILQGNLHSGDTYATLEVGGTYDFETVGWRWHFPTTYPNVLDAERVG